LALQGLDFSLPPESAPLPEDGIIKIVRVREEVLLEQAPLPFGATQQALPDVEIDTIQIVSAGEYGLTAQRVRVIYEAHPDEQGWQEIERQVEAEWVAREPQPRVIGYGTKIVIRTENVGGTAIEYWRKVEVYASTYSPCRLGIPDYCSTTTSSGAQLQKGMIATTIEWYRYMKGLPVFVPNYGFATIEDVGGGLPDRHWVDLGYSEEDFVGWAGWTTIYFLTPVPGNILYILEYGG
ncbi:MAG: G5 domain-containing protein, partial [Anaerolineae bacterium]|nr:G5 domain-containing protein [Anaerolineae bacterium]